ncbi:TauD/TfdA dioxygenase family protein [Candidimonas nitroreducens]|uniref:2,4-dichlorophenoxyacetate dioxygenase n=1 Tax=Candidimonas nitroreducens TaxID=683354 RepID=A0A225M684_9BURK|nr:TauD/TfdA family dioxygenase [Candidimonas nitroreducens]OWT56788.1 2,4-dichlorophenoxyacetate dioxygenase [Candidimonas nitroreducens]
MFEIAPVNGDFVAEIAGVNLQADLTTELARQLQAALDKYAVLILPNQPLDETQHLRVAEVFGPLETSIGSYVANANKPRRLKYDQLSDISNIDESGKLLSNDDMRKLVLLSNQLWHTDSSFKRVPASVSMLAAQEIPPLGGATEFADMRAAWDQLDPEMQSSIEGLVAVHDYFHSRSLTGFDICSIPSEWRSRQPPAKQVLVRTHNNNRKSIYLAAHIQSIVGLPDDEGKALIDRLMSFATQPAFVYRHRWRENDLVIWDNRCTMHRGRDYDTKYRRVMRRATIQDIGPTVIDQ